MCFSKIPIQKIEWEENPRIIHIWGNYNRINFKGLLRAFRRLGMMFFFFDSDNLTVEPGFLNDVASESLVSGDIITTAMIIKVFSIESCKYPMSSDNRSSPVDYSWISSYHVATRSQTLSHP